MTPTLLKLGVAAHLRAWQARRAYSQVDCAQCLNVSPSSYNKLLYGTGSLNLELLCRIARVTGFTVGELVTPPEEPVDLTRRWRTSDLVARIDNVKAVALAMEREG